MKKPITKKFITTKYEIHSDKIKSQRGVRFVMLTDLHGLTFGKDNEQLLLEIQKQNPDAVLVTGDMIVRNDPETIKRAEQFLKKIVNQYEVYYSLGNHECRIYADGGGHPCYGEYMGYERRLQHAGVHFLHNEKAKFTIDNTKFTIFGLEIPMIYYRKPKSPYLTLAAMEKCIGRPEEDGVNILLAHNPKYGRTYLNWGADLILSGHYHGGVLRLNKHVGLTSPQFLLFPPYCCGDFHKGRSHMLVSAGIGEHTIPFRIHNPRELLVIDIKPLEI